MAAGIRSAALHTLDTAGREKLWHVETAGFVISSPAVGEGVVTFSSYDGTVYALR